jgi:hypothetical protein
MSKEPEVKHSRGIGITFSILLIAACVFSVVQVTDSSPNWNSLLSIPVIILSGMAVRFLEHAQQLDTGLFILVIIMMTGFTMIVVSAFVEQNKTLQQVLANMGSGLTGVGVGGIFERKRLSGKQSDANENVVAIKSPRRPNGGTSKQANRNGANAKR